MEHELVRGQRDRLADGLGRDPLGQGLGHRLGGLLPAGGVDRLAHLLDPGVVRLAISRRAARQAVAVEQLRQEGPQRLLGFVATDAALLVHAEPHRLAEQRVGVLLAGEVEQGPGAPGEHDAVDVDVILDDVLEVVVGLVERPARQRGEGPLGRLHVLPPGRLAQGFRPRQARGHGGRLDGMQGLVVQASHLLDVVGVAVEDLQDRQRPLRLGQLARHLVRRHQRHDRVVAIVILAAERAGVGQRGGRHQLAEVGPGLDPLDDGRQEPVGGRLLHQGHQRLHRAERQAFGAFVGQGGRGQAQVLGQRRAHAGDQHAPAHVRQKLTTVIATHDLSPRRDAPVEPRSILARRTMLSMAVPSQRRDGSSPRHYS